MSQQNDDTQTGAIKDFSKKRKTATAKHPSVETKAEQVHSIIDEITKRKVSKSRIDAQLDETRKVSQDEIKAKDEKVLLIEEEADPDAVSEPEAQTVVHRPKRQKKTRKTPKKDGEMAEEQKPEEPSKTPVAEKVKQPQVEPKADQVSPEPAPTAEGPQDSAKEDEEQTAAEGQPQEPESPEPGQADQQMDQSASGQERTQVSENEPEKDKVIEAQPAFESPEQPSKTPFASQAQVNQGTGSAAKEYAIPPLDFNDKMELRNNHEVDGEEEEGDGPPEVELAGNEILCRETRFENVEEWEEAHCTRSALDANKHGWPLPFSEATRRFEKFAAGQLREVKGTVDKKEFASYGALVVYPQDRSFLYRLNHEGTEGSINVVDFREDRVKALN